jgi:hypothetical protein
LALQNHLPTLFFTFQNLWCNSIIYSFSFSISSTPPKNSSMALVITWSPIVNFLFFSKAFIHLSRTMGLFCYFGLWCVCNVNEGVLFGGVVGIVSWLLHNTFTSSCCIHPLIYPIWHTHDSSNTTKNVVKDIIPWSPCWGCHIGLSLLGFLLFILLPHPQPFVSYLLPCLLRAIGKLDIELFYELDPISLPKGFAIILPIFFLTHSHRTFCSPQSTLSIKLPCKTSPLHNIMSEFRHMSELGPLI